MSDFPRAGEEKEKYVRSLFNSIARRYDTMNLIMTAGVVKLWHRAFPSYTGLRPGGTCLDVACGTGDLTMIAARQVAPSGKVIGVDFSEEMLEVGRQRVAQKSPHARLIEMKHGNAMDLPFADNSFDCATIGFALRNVPDIARCVSEMTRVVKPGGRVVSLEISKPKNRLIRSLYFLHFYNIVPLVDRLVERGRGSGQRIRPYTYLPNSLTHFPDQDRLADIFRGAGLSDVGYKGLTGGIVTIHYGTKPGA